MSEQINPEFLQQQIAAYAKEFPIYKNYAAALKRVLEKACEVSVPGVIVQTRAKDIASFAEKCVRKFAKYKNPVKDLTDL